MKDWDPQWEAENMPATLPRLSVALQPVPDFLYEALVIARKQGYVNLVLLHSIRDIARAKEQPKEELSQSLHIATSPNFLGADLPHLVEVSWPPYPANCSITPSRDMGLLVHVLWTLLQRQIAVRNHPSGTPTTTIPSTEKTLWASRRGPTTPSLEYAILPATLNTFQLLNDLAIHHGVGPFLQPSTYTPRSPLDLLQVMRNARDSWGWMKESE